MGSDELYVIANLVNEKVRFHASSNLRPSQEIAFDYVPPLGDGEGYLGLEMLLVSFSGCVSTGIVVLLRRMGHTVSEYKMKAVAYRREQPVLLERIEAVISLGTTDIPAEDVQKAIEQASAISPVWLAIKGNVQVSVEYRAL